MSSSKGSVVIAGAGMFGLTASLELHRRGYSVIVVDRGPVPHPLASSNDTSRMVRMDYGKDTLYMDLADKAIQGWRDWNRRWGVEMFHETGLLVMTNQPMAPGSFEYETFALLTERGHQPQRLNSGTLAQRFGQWNPEKYVDGYYNPIRCHSALDGDAPIHRPPERLGDVVATPILGGLHHRYHRIAA